ncbi:hypothetical protein [Kutzneria albida]|uniref:Uncharacterized protein n=1 Tax=Kutzneria albida DSM 43870 TaxID=1449976 RepID=W5WDQ3_9PSEU|nr:hypothetical protein [Kutzneria albida]AHH98992.1 hypothetical protein KALB_5630 [Kutzneria albida DSM 43870]
MRTRGFDRRMSRRGAVVAALVVGASCASATPASANSPAATALTETTQPAQQVTLITGDQVTVLPESNGVTNYALSPSTQLKMVQSVQSDGGDRYVIPADAMPYLGQLDRSLFDVTALARTGVGKTGKIPLELSFPDGAAPAALPGITLTSAARDTATGYLDLESARAFGAALHQRIAEDLAAGRPAGSTALPATIRLAGAPRQDQDQGAQPRYPMHYLEIALTDLNGKSVNGMVSLVNTDSAAKASKTVEVRDGVTRIAVPAGHYAAYSTFTDRDADGTVKASRTATVEGFVVDDSPTTHTLTLDERTATTLVKVTAPKPATEDLLTLSFYREDPADRGIALTVVGYQLPEYVTPIAKPTSGRLHYVVQWGGKAPKAEDRYRVDLSFAAEGIPAQQSFSTKESELATVRDVLHTDPADTVPVAIDNGPVDPVILRHGLGGTGFFVPAPGVLTDYLGTSHTTKWAQYEMKGSSRQLMTADPHTYRPGTTTTTDWSRGPLSAGLGQWTGKQSCQACFAGGTVALGIPMLRDSVPDHTAVPLFYSPQTHYSLYRDDKQLFDQDGVQGAVVEVPKTPATFRGVLDVDRTAIPGVGQASKLRTELTVKYDPGARNTPLPGPHTCHAANPAQPCQIFGTLTVDYRLDADLTTTSKAALQKLGLHVGHVAYSGAGSHSPITSVTVSVSFDDGATWTPAKVTGALGNYAAVWRNLPEAAGKSPSLKVTAQDKADNAISQTITNAYTIAKSGN